MADKEKAQRDVDREYELNRQALILKATEGVTRDKDGNPIAVVVNPRERPDGSLRDKG